MLVIHVTDKKTAEIIKNEGYQCRDYLGKHPIGEKCTTFFYPLNGVGQDLEFAPQNARMQGKDVDEYATYVICEVDKDCRVGDLHLELAPEQYRAGAMPLNEYGEYEFNRGQYEEPEVVCYQPVSPTKVLAVLPHSKMKAVFDACPLGEKTECMKNKLLALSGEEKK